MITDKEQLIEIYEQLVGDDGINRYTHKEIIKYINQLKDIEENKDDWRYVVWWNTSGQTNRR